MKIKNNIYWNNYYNEDKAPVKSSNFSKFCKKFLKKGDTLIDIGCGNGRDTVFFLKKNINCFGIDQSSRVIKKNKKKFKKFKKFFLCKDFSKLNFQIFKPKVFSIYSRFTLHTINNLEEKRLFKNIKKSKGIIKYLMIETRTVNDDLFGSGKRISKNEFLSSHYRRFIDPKEIKKKLKKFSKIIYFKEAKNFAKFKNENPWILRIIVKIN